MTRNVSFPSHDEGHNCFSTVGIQLAFYIGVNRTLIKILLSIAVLASCATAVAQTKTTDTLAPADKQIAESFEKRVKVYTKLRESLEEQMPKLSTEAKPEEIQTHKKQFQDRVRAARTGAKHGEIFTPEAQGLIRRIIKDEFKGRERAEFRDTVVKEADTKGVPLRVNYQYAEAGALVEMSAELFL